MLIATNATGFCPFFVSYFQYSAYSSIEPKNEYPSLEKSNPLSHKFWLVPNHEMIITLKRIYKVGFLL